MKTEGKYTGGLLPLGLEVTVSVGLFVHKGIVTGNSPWGVPFITSNSFRLGYAAEESIDVFSGGKNVTLVGFRGSLPPNQCAARARSMIGARWTLDFNCEHFVSKACGEKPNSPQLKFWGGLIGVTGAMLLARAAAKNN